LSDPFSFTVMLVLSLVAPIAAWLSHRARDMVRRLDRVPTRAVRDLAPGMAEVAGALRAEQEPLRTLGGERAVAVRRRFSCSYRVNQQTKRSLVLLDEVDAVPIVLEDESGSCVLALDPAVVLGSERRLDFEPKAFQAAHPACMDRIRSALFFGGEIRTVHVEECWVPEGASGFVSGTAIVDAVEPAEGYRGSTARFRMHGDEESPLIVSSWSERRIRRHVAMPALRLAWVAIASLLVVIAIVASGRVLAAIAGLG
jgi:hypothetical protein